MASRGWLEGYLRRSHIQGFYRLHGKGHSALPSSHVEKMKGLRSIASEYEPRNMYIVDESGLFYRMGTRRSYLAAHENRATARGTEFMKHKQRVIVVLSCNADGSHILPVSYIRNAETPRCFRDHRYAHVVDRYWAQKNAWMYSNGFQKCIFW